MNVVMPRQIPWSRLLFEGFVIVTSILLAFAIDAWWDARQEQRAAQQLLVAVAEEADANRQRIEDIVRRVEANQGDTRRFYAMLENDLRAVPADTAFRMTESMWVPNTFEFAHNALATATSAEGARLIGDLETWRALSRLQGQLDDFSERFQLLADASQHVLLAMGEHPLQQARFLGGESIVDQVVDLRSIRNDAKVLAAASTMQQNREIYLIFLRRFSESIDQTMRAVADRP